MDLKLIKTANETVIRRFWDFKSTVDYVDQWPLMKSPVPLMLLTISYLLFVLNLGPKYMKTRQPYNISNIIILYNIFQVMYSCFLMFTGIRLISSYGLLTSSCLMEEEESKWIITSSTHYYFIAKATELLDTIFFVLRKNNRQITFLHIYHHSLMLWSTWITLKYEPTYNTIFLGTLNSFVHIIMYAYYALSAFPGLVKYLWWKKYITMLQLFQFITVILQTAVSYAHSGCPPSYTLTYTIFVNGLLFIYLFGKFYINSYVNNRRSKKSIILQDSAISSPNKAMDVKSE